MQVFRLTGSGLAAQARAPARRGEYVSCATMISVPQRGEVVSLDPDWACGGGNRVTYRRASTLQPVGDWREFTGEGGVSLSASRDGRQHALGVGTRDRNCFVDVVTDTNAAVAAGLTGRAPGRYTPDDLAPVEAVMRDTAAGSPARPLLELLRTRLEYQLEQDVAISTAPGAAAGRDEFALGSEGDPG